MSPALLAATCLLQVVIFCWKVICLIEDTIPNRENLASLRKTRPLLRSRRLEKLAPAHRSGASCSLGDASRGSSRLAPRIYRAFHVGVPRSAQSKRDSRKGRVGMTQPSDISRTRVRLSKLGMGEEDVSWLEARRWSEAAIPPVMWPCDTHVYRRP